MEGSKIYGFIVDFETQETDMKLMFNIDEKTKILFLHDLEDVNGSYLQIGKEIVYIENVYYEDHILWAIRGVLGTSNQKHCMGDKVVKLTNVTAKGIET